MKKLVFLVSFCILAATLTAQQISKGEYFFDTDPGVGNGTAITVTQSDSIQLNTTVSTGALNPGFHKLVMRFCNVNGVWSHNEARPLYVSATPGAVATLISKAEYFFDVDPGKGNGTALAIVAGDSSMYNSTISTGVLTPGFHKLVMRFCNNNNVWSHNEARIVYVSPTPSIGATQITAAEYFFDVDPGVGNGTLATITPGDSALLVAPLPSTGLSVGFHKMCFRFRDSNGKWGHNEARSVYIAPSPPSQSTQIIAAEYFFDDTDPGVGKATPIIGFTPGDSVTIKNIIVAAGLAAGQTHKLTIRAKDDKNVWSLNETRTFDVCNAPAVAGFTTSLYGNTLTLTNSSTNAYGYIWKFGDDSTSTTKNPVHTYSYGGKFDVYLIALNPCGNDTMIKTINFNCSQPSAYLYTTINQLTVGVTNSCSGATSYSWSFGDGFTSTEYAPNHTYYAGGTYSVCVTATNGCGSDTYCTNVNVTCFAPVAQFTSSVNGLTAYFNNQSTNAANINWYFGDGGISNLLSPDHTYNTAGTYSVKLVVSNACGKDSVTHNRTFSCTMPVPSFHYNADGLTVQFENNSTSATTYSWNFGDTKTSTLKNPTHKFPSTGSYNICMVATNGCGKDSVCELINVCTPPTADFIYSDSALTTTFTNASLNGESYFWTFGTTDASNIYSPQYTYPTPGTYNVCLNVTNSCGADKICKNVSTSCTAFGAPQICLVTTDSASNYNVIYWDKTPYAGGGVDSFIVYREVSSNIYKPIAVKAYSDSSYFVDTVRARYALPLASGDPRKGTYRYKIQFKDTCGGFSPLSRFHNTIYIVYNGNGQFTWNSYTIEGLANPVNNYVLMRDTSGSGRAWKQIASVAGTQNTLADNNFSKYPTGSWRVQTLWGITCIPSMTKHKGDGTQSLLTTKVVNSSKSNIKENLPVVGIDINELNKLIQVYPNPTNSNLNVEWPISLAADEPRVAVRNYLGQEIMKYTPEKSQLKVTFNIAGLAVGMYFVEVRSNNYRMVKKVIVQ
ncbi:MAG: PKD domain-containing protein [Bacteroidia bacterium]|nr:PKD domain-containing protein [Bacteroidia bacterium]